MIERHPLKPFLPAGARVLFLGSFPPPRQRWCMDFFYPNFLNDFWRICALVFTGDKSAFIVPGEKRFDREKIIELCTAKGIAIFDTASSVRRQKGNASDKFLEIIEPTDIESLLAHIPDCHDIAATGQKAVDILAERYGIKPPPIGTYAEVLTGGKPVRLWRMPSTSRAYPLPLEEKAKNYRKMFGFLYS